MHTSFNYKLKPKRMQEMGVISNEVPHEISFSKDYEKRTMYIYKYGHDFRS